MADADLPIQIGIGRLYVKDLSFESPQSPSIFTAPFQPSISLDVKVTHQRLASDTYEVVLRLTAEARSGEKVGFIVEVEQAGLFDIKVQPGVSIDHVLGIFCPQTLFPYARQVVDQALVLGSMPPLGIAPINFEALYQQNSRNN